MHTEKTFQKLTIEKNLPLVKATFERLLGESGIQVKVDLIKPQVENHVTSNEPPEKIKNLMRIFQARHIDTLAVTNDNNGGNSVTVE